MYLEDSMSEPFSKATTISDLYEYSNEIALEYYLYLCSWHYPSTNIL